MKDVILPLIMTVLGGSIGLCEKYKKNPGPGESNKFVYLGIFLTIFGAIATLYSGCNAEGNKKIALAKSDSIFHVLDSLQKEERDSTKSILIQGHITIQKLNTANSEVHNALTQINTLNVKSERLIQGTRKTLLVAEQLAYPIDSVNIAFEYTYTIPGESFDRNCPDLSSDALRKKYKGFIIAGNDTGYQIPLNIFKKSASQDYIQRYAPTIKFLKDSSSSLGNMGDVVRNTVWISGMSILNQKEDGGDIACQVTRKKDDVCILIRGYFKTKISMQGYLKVYGMKELIGMFIKFNIPVPWDCISSKLADLRIWTDKMNFRFSEINGIQRNGEVEFNKKINSKDVTTIPVNGQ